MPGKETLLLAVYVFTFCVPLNNWKFADPVTPVTVAATIYPPLRLFAEKTEEVAIPFAFVSAVETWEWVFANVPLAPLAGAVKVTVTPVKG